MIWNQIMFEESSELAEGNAIPEPENVEEAKEEVIVPEPEQKKEVKKPKVTPKKKKTTTIVEEEEESTEEETPVTKTKSPDNDLILTNRILEAVIETGLDKDVLSALIKTNLQVAADGTDNFNELITTYKEKYPSLVKGSKPVVTPTAGINPTNVTTQKQKEEVLRERYFGSNSNTFFNGGGVRN